MRINILYEDWLEPFHEDVNEETFKNRNRAIVWQYIQPERQAMIESAMAEAGAAATPEREMASVRSPGTGLGKAPS